MIARVPHDRVDIDIGDLGKRLVAQVSARLPLMISGAPPLTG